MTRLGTLFWLGLVLAAGFTTFKVKYAVQDIEDQLNRVRKQTIAEQQEIRVLTAEWTFLTQPERLAELNRRFLGLAPIAPKQLQRTVADIPLRALPAPPAEPPDVLVSDVVAPDVVAPDIVASDVAAPDVAAQASPDSAAGPSPAAAPTAGASPIPDTAPTPASALAMARAILSPAAAKPAVRVQLAKAGPGRPPGSLDALIAQIADTR
jgi:hypothetical protein